MKKPRYLLSAAVAILLLGLPFSATPQFQNRIEVLQVPGERHHFAVHLLRIINTVEAEHHIKQGSYVSWDVLRTTADFSPLFLTRGYQVGMQVYNQPGPAPEIFPGWSLRLNVSADGKGYDRSEEHTSELQSRLHLVCRLLLEKKKKICALCVLTVLVIQSAHSSMISNSVLLQLI